MAAASLNESLRDIIVHHQIAIGRFSAKTSRQVVELLDSVEGDIVRQLSKFDPTQPAGYSEKRLRKLLNEIKAINGDNFQEVKDFLDNHLKELAAYEAQWQADALERSMPVDWPMAQPTAKELENIIVSKPFHGRLLDSWTDGLEAGKLDRIAQALRIGLVQGETVDQLVRRLVGTKALNYKDGVMELSRRSAGTFVRTAVSHVVNQARLATYEANDDVVGRLQWVSVLDSRTSAFCRAEDGDVWNVGESHIMPPAHPNCRSIVVPVTKTWRQMGIPVDEMTAGTRASVNGQVPKDMNYNEWLKTQPISVVEDALGKSRAKLFTEGHLTMQQFVDPTGEEYTLAELAKRDKSAFKKAGLSL